MKQTRTRHWQRERGSALLLTLLLTLVGAAVLGLLVDATSLLWARSNVQTTADFTAVAVGLEKERNPSASPEYLLETAKAAAALNGYRHGVESAIVQLEERNGTTAVLIGRESKVFFLSIIHYQPVAIRARAEVTPSVDRARL